MECQAKHLQTIGEYDGHWPQPVERGGSGCGRRWRHFVVGSQPFSVVVRTDRYDFIIQMNISECRFRLAEEAHKMRFSVLDLTMAIAINAGAFLCLRLLFHITNIPVLVVSGAVVYLVVSSPIYRFFHLLPLLLPRCPACGDRNRHYRSCVRSWPREDIECANCHAQITLCHEPKKCDHNGPEGPRFDLLWPYSFGGRWRRVA